MCILDPKRLLPGDIIFTRDKRNLTSIAIRAVSGSLFSHAILFVDAYSYIDSDMEGVHANNPQYKLFASASDVAVKRYKQPISEESLDKICDYARPQIGKRYSVPNTFGSVIWFISGNLKTVDRQFCSRLVAMSYAAAGIHLVRNPLRCTPNRVFRSADLVSVPGACREASQAELPLAARGAISIVTKQEEITNKLLADVRAATNSQVETISDVVKLVIAKPETDAKVLSILNDSGYLVMWRDMRQQFPEWYDAGIYAQSVPAELQREIADNLHKSILNSLRGHRHNNEVFLEAFSHHQRRTICDDKFTRLVRPVKPDCPKFSSPEVETDPVIFVEHKTPSAPG